MIINQFIPLIITFVVTLISSYITIRITITELKKDQAYLREKLETEILSKAQHEAQSKEDMKEVKEDLKMIFKSINEIQVNFARMEARNEGKDEVITELKNAVTMIIKEKNQ
jgi:hypothetical protein